MRVEGAYQARVVLLFASDGRTAWRTNKLAAGTWPERLRDNTIFFYSFALFLAEGVIRQSAYCRPANGGVLCELG